MQALPEDLITVAPATRKSRRQLLPWWIKTFMWIFLVFGAMVPVVLIMALLGYQASLSLYGLGTNDPFSLTGLILIGCFALKAMVAYGLWAGKAWAMKLAIADAIVGIVICCVSMMSPATINTAGRTEFAFRLELILLIPYLIKCIKLRTVWESDVDLTANPS